MLEIEIYRFPGFINLTWAISLLNKYKSFNIQLTKWCITILRLIVPITAFRFVWQFRILWENICHFHCFLELLSHLKCSGFYISSSIWNEKNTGTKAWQFSVPVKPNLLKGKKSCYCAQTIHSVNVFNINNICRKKHLQI